MKPSVKRNIHLFYVLSFLSNFRLNAAILIIYLQYQTHSFALSMSLLSVMMIVGSVLDAPTGAIADIFGRKKTIIIAYVLGFFHLLFLALGTNYVILLISFIIAGIAMALGSGADDALVYDSLIQLNKEDEYKKVSGNANSLLPLSLAIAAPIGSFLASVAFSLPFWLHLIPQVIAVILTFFLIEPKYQKPIHRNIFLHMGTSIKEIFSNSQLIYLLLIGGLFFGVGETVQVIYPKWFQLNIPLQYIGLAVSFISGAVALGSFLAGRVSNFIEDKQLLLWSTVYSIVIALLATLFFGLISVILAISTAFFYGMRGPIMNFLIRKLVSSSQRATIGSFAGVFQRGLYAIFGIVLGLIADKFGVIRAIQASVIFLIPTILLISLLRLKPQMKSQVN